MTYIQFDIDTPQNPKLVRLALLLKIPQIYACGVLAALWSWSMKYAPDGDLSRFDREEVAAGIGFPGVNQRRSSRR